MDLLHETVVDLELTSGCCSNCVFCPRDKIRRLRQTMEMETVADLANHLSPNHVVWLSGMGEPLLHKDFVAIVRMLRRSGCLVYTNTNGMAPQTEVKLAVAKPDFVNLSLYGMDRESFKRTTGRDEFELVMARIEWLRTSGLRWRLSYVTGDFNASVRADLKAELDKMSGGNARLLTAHSRTFGEEGQQVPPVCGLCEHYLFVACDGRILSCAHDVSAENVFDSKHPRPSRWISHREPGNPAEGLIWASKEKRWEYPFKNCYKCDSQGLKFKALEPGYFDKVRSLGR